MATLLFGDSFIGPFSLFKNNDIKINWFSGATMKGLAKNDNKNIIKIKHNINKYNPNIKCIIFSFGQVDLNFSFYYNLILKHKIIDLKKIIKDYVKVVKELKTNAKKIIINIYPTALKDEHLLNSLVMYQVIQDSTIDSINKDKFYNYANFKVRKERLIEANRYLKKECIKNNIRFLDINKHILDENYVVKDKFVDKLSNYNIHILWEPLIPILINYLNSCGFSKKYLVDLNKSQKDYKESKTKRNLERSPKI